MVLGLGNPGESYTHTRHNVGFQVVDLVAERLGCRFRKPFLQRFAIAKGVGRYAGVVLSKPLTFMNRSGEILHQLLSRTDCTVSDILVVCDNLDLPVGSCRLKARGSSAGHNGLASLIQHAGTSDFKRLYVGIGRPPNGTVVEHVLGLPEVSERGALATAVRAAADGVLSLFEEPIEKVMNELNRRRD